MAEQAELDLPPVPAPSGKAARSRRAALFAGLTRWQMLGGLMLLAALVWAMWVTRQVSARTDHIVSVKLSELVGEYVEAQRYSASPPERVKAEMQAFMASLDKELARRSAHGDVILVGEAVLSKNVDDITETVKKAVYASGVPIPKRITAEELQRLQQMSLQAAPEMPVPQDPRTTAPASAAQATAQPVPSVLPPAVGAQGATVSSFGAPDVGPAQ
ncbi:hypothetical protein Swit_5373 (plasmid) [Rhizorhabdus wittichii RW1]|uniref:Uncharacterized protein n=1 Tax=Rhizorhabdus wittichii (strain DSM 6014 / CCUG 31198 / JCM 15750 / NBRC 105917 / EY 4224 / RW1) TaxID=392499 RepID=A0A9J9LH93_RHIWR|nr:hypothetical protein Swit_5373 [Rhizorhabdus wittichii RW1]